MSDCAHPGPTSNTLSWSAKASITLRMSYARRRLSGTMFAIFGADSAGENSDGSSYQYSRNRWVASTACGTSSTTRSTSPWLAEFATELVPVGLIRLPKSASTVAMTKSHKKARALWLSRVAPVTTATVGAQPDNSVKPSRTSHRARV